jgi:hypothetical protein
MERIYSEVKCDYNNGDGFWTLDAWYPNNDNGTVIGVINELTGGVYLFKDNDPLAEEVANEKVKEIESERIEILASYYNSLTDAEKDEFLRLTGNQ